MPGLWALNMVEMQVFWVVLAFLKVGEDGREGERWDDALVSVPCLYVTEAVGRA